MRERSFVVSKTREAKRARKRDGRKKKGKPTFHDEVEVWVLLPQRPELDVSLYPGHRDRVLLSSREAVCNRERTTRVSESRDASKRKAWAPRTELVAGDPSPGSESILVLSVNARDLTKAERTSEQSSNERRVEVRRSTHVGQLRELAPDPRACVVLIADSVDSNL